MDLRNDRGKHPRARQNGPKLQLLLSLLVCAFRDEEENDGSGNNKPVWPNTTLLAQKLSFQEQKLHTL